ncbi:MAG: hypothetical protein FJX77_15620 [Armatimonadetes bacterium]|nr:hypothetical protein [Armatimonadota bacterium]
MRATLPLLGALVALWQAPTLPLVDLSSPEAAVRSFFRCVNRHELREARKCLADLPATSGLEELEADLRAHEPADAGVQVEKVSREGGGDTVTLLLRLRPTPVVPGTPEVEERITATRTAAGWKLRAPPPVSPGRPGTQAAVLPVLVAALGEPRTVLVARRTARRERCRQTLRVLMGATVLYATDHDDRFAFTARNYQSRLLAYVRKDPRAFHCAETGTPYTLNPKMEGAPTRRMFRPGATVVFYEGQGGKLDFRHDGQSLVGFADGSVRLVSPAELEVLRWTP